MYRSPSSRIIAASWWMFVLLMTLCYSANLAAFLTTSTFDTTFNSLDDLLEENDLKYGVFEHQYPIIHNLLEVRQKTNPFLFCWSPLQKSKLAAHQKLARIIEKDITKVTWNDPLDNLVQDKLIVLGFSMDYEAFDPQISCQLYTVGPPLFYSYNGIAVQKRKKVLLFYKYISKGVFIDSPYLKSINQALLTFYTDGTLEILKGRWIKLHKGCTQTVNRYLEIL